MEKWIESDMLSGLPIQYGDPIVAFLVAECRHRVGYSDRSSFPDEKWQPISMPIRGTYQMCRKTPAFRHGDIRRLKLRQKCSFH